MLDFVEKLDYQSSFIAYETKPLEIYLSMPFLTKYKNHLAKKVFNLLMKKTYKTFEL